MDGEPAALVHAKDALNATGVWNSRKRALDSVLSVTSRSEHQITGFSLYLPDLTINAERDRGGKWQVDRSEHSWGVPVEPLIYKPRSSRRMGKSRITRPAMSIQDAALRALNRLEAHMDIYAIPKLILLGASDAMFKNPEGRDMAIACAKFFDSVVDGSLRHTDQPQMNVALSVARKRPLGAGWAWNRKDAASDITPVVAETLALWGAQNDNAKRPGGRTESSRTAVIM